jgi:hypothetical protein
MIERRIATELKDLLDYPERRMVYPGSERFPLNDGVEAIPLSALGRALAGYGGPELRS